VKHMKVILIKNQKDKMIIMKLYMFGKKLNV